MDQHLTTDATNDTKLESIHQRILDVFFRIFIIIGILPIMGSAVRIVQHGWSPHVLIHMSGYLFFIFIYFQKNRIRTGQTVWLIAIFLIFTGFINLAGYGLASMGVTLFLFTIVMAMVFLGTGPTIFISIFIVTGFAFMGWIICTGRYPMNFDAGAYITSWSAWINQISVLIITSIVTIVFISGLITPLLTALKSLRRRTDEVFDTNSLLIESEQKISTIVRTAPDSIITTDLNSMITSCNNAALELFEADSGDALKSSAINRLFIPDDHSRVLSDIGRLLNGEIIKAVPYTIVTKKGNRTPVRISGSALKNSNGTIYGLLCMLQDVSQTQQMEEQLRRAEKMQAIGQLAGGVAHDFNNQLAGIVGYADLIREHVADNPTLSRYADNILIATKRSSDLTNQLLAFSRKGKYFSIPVDIHCIIAEVIAILQRTIDRRITITRYIHSQSAIVRGDPTQLQNAILNIALNARDAMPEGGELSFTTCDTAFDTPVCFAATFDLAAGPYLKLSITDTGIGMSAETAGKIFEPFFTTKEQGKGTGMGLASVYGTIKSHNGCIEVTSTQGKGTTMQLYFPLVVDTEINQTNNAITIQRHHPAAHILLVDDEDLVIDMAKAMLEKSGHTVSVCDNGKETVERYRTDGKNIDLVLLDLIMPVMNGHDTFYALKKIDPDVRVLISSGFSIDDKTRNLLDNGAAGFIQKPFQRHELVTKLQEILQIS